MSSLGREAVDSVRNMFKTKEAVAAPEPGVPDDEERMVVKRMYDLLDEANAVRETYHKQWDRNKQRYLGNPWINDDGSDSTKLEGLTYASINKTQNSVLKHSQVQSEIRPRIVFGARETGEKGHWRVRKEAGATLGKLFEAQLALPPSGLNDGELMGVDPILDPLTAKSLMQYSDPWTDTAGNLRGPAIEPDDIIEVTDALAAQVAQVAHDIFFDLSNTADWLWDHQVHRNIIGHQGAIYEFDERLMRDNVTDIHVKNMWMDPIVETVEDAEFVVVVQIISKARAMAMYPDIADDIQTFDGNKMDTFSGLQLGRSSITVGATYTEHTFERDMVALWTVWTRFDKDYPVEPDDAIAEGLVNMERQIKDIEEDEEGLPVKVEESVFTLEDGSPTAPGDKNWPSRPGVRQVRIVADRLADDQECPHWDIPVLWSRNIPIPYRPYGQGEPERLESIDDLINRLLSAFIDYARYFRSPQEVYPASIWESMKKHGAGMHTRPNQKIIVPDDLFERHIAPSKRGGFGVEPPPINSGFFALYDRLVQEHADLSGAADVLQGIPPGASSSGEAIDTLQTAARGVIAFKANGTERMLRRLAHLRIHALKRWMPERMWHRMIGKWPSTVIDDVLGRRAMKEPDFDITVEVAAGRANTKRFEQAKAVQVRGMGDIDRLTLLETLDYANPEQIVRRIAEEQGLASSSSPEVSQLAQDQMTPQDVGPEQARRPQGQPLNV